MALIFETQNFIVDAPDQEDIAGIREELKRLLTQPEFSDDVWGLI